jgi:hypothetical protein
LSRAHDKLFPHSFCPSPADALNKYLEYAPFGQHASAVRDTIDKLNEEIETQYKPAAKTVKK